MLLPQTYEAIFIVLQGHEQDALKLMASYLPKDSNAGSAYQEGGGLYALGTYTW